MINVVFLLLIFFLMSATLVAPTPVQLRAPGVAAAPKASPAPTLHLGADGTVAHGDLRGAAAYDAVAAALVPGQAAVIRADRDLPGAALAEALAALAARGAPRALLAVDTGAGAGR
jgi:biopolymer transport protein ExbD